MDVAKIVGKLNHATLKYSHTSEESFSIEYKWDLEHYNMSDMLFICSMIKQRSLHIYQISKLKIKYLPDQLLLFFRYKISKEMRLFFLGSASVKKGSLPW